jgi:uncharacterized membrane protein YkvA (DUF1232 family)
MPAEGTGVTIPAMPGWLVALLFLLALYAAGVAALALAGRRTDAAAVARLVPDCVILVRRLAADERLPRRNRLALAALVAYLVMPIDVIPDFVPIAGYLDDAILVVLVLRSVVRAAGPTVIAQHWPGRPRGLQIVVRALRV